MRKNRSSETRRWQGWVLAVAFALPGLGTAGFAADEQASKWEFEAQPYAWLAGNFGSVTVKGRTARITVTPVDLYHLLEDGQAFGAAGYFSLAYDRFSVFADSVGGYAEEKVTETFPRRFLTLSVSARDKIKFAVTDAALGYRLGQWSLPGRRRSLTLGVYAGTRGTFFSNKLTVSGELVGRRVRSRSASVFDSFAWADPLIGVRWSLPVLDSVSLDFRGDIGGFGASSQLVWGLVGSVRYWVPWTPVSTHPYLAGGYRVVDFDRSSSPGSVEMQMRGPFAGAGFVF